MDRERRHDLLMVKARRACAQIQKQSWPHLVELFLELVISHCYAPRQNQRPARRKKEKNQKKEK